MKGIIDRIEEGVGVIQLEEGGEMLLPAERFPPGSEEGSVLEIIIALDKKAATERREDIRKRQERLK